MCFIGQKKLQEKLMQVKCSMIFALENIWLVIIWTWESALRGS